MSGRLAVTAKMLSRTSVFLISNKTAFTGKNECPLMVLIPHWQIWLPAQMCKPTVHQVFSLITGAVTLFPVWLESRRTSGAENCNLLMENEVLSHWPCGVKVASLASDPSEPSFLQFLNPKHHLLCLHISKYVPLTSGQRMLTLSVRHCTSTSSPPSSSEAGAGGGGTR